MTATTRPPAPLRTSRIAAGSAGAVLVVAVVGLLARDRLYGSETEALSDAAVAQDLVTATVVAPVLVGALLLSRHGSAGARLVAIGAWSFLAYNYAIYCFSVRFGPLFLPWTALLGLSTWLLVSGVVLAVDDELHERVRPGPLAAMVLCGVAALFAALWLLQIVTDTAAGRGSTSAEAWHVPTDPVHVLDLAFALPAAFWSGWFLRARRPGAMVLAPVMLVFFVLTSVPIVVTPVVAAARAHDAPWGAAGPVALVATVSLVALARVLRREP